MATVKLDAREFSRTLARYAKLSKTAFPELCNRKALFIAMGAQNQTPKAEWNAARAGLGGTLTYRASIGKRGPGRRGKLGLEDNYGSTLAVRIIIARLRKAGAAIPKAAELKRMALKLIRARAASVAFIKSGWSPAIRILKRRTRGVPASGDGGRIIGQTKGGGEAAKPGEFAKAVIWNLAQAKKFGTKNKTALFKFGGPALQRAFDAETASTEKEIEKRMREDAHSISIKTN